MANKTSANLKVCLIITEANKVLLIKEKTSKDNVFKWNIIKGTVDDEDIIEAALREAEEEVNVKVDLKGSLGVHVKYYGNNKYTVYLSFIAEIVEGDPRTTDLEKQAEGEDITEVKWFTNKEIGDLKEEDFVLDVSYLFIQRFLNNVRLPFNAITSQDLKSV